MTANDTLENQMKLKEIYSQIEQKKKEIEQLEKRAEIIDELISRGG